VRQKWAGLRSFVNDRSPVVGFDPCCPGFFWLAALGGYGIQTAPALSRIAAALALDLALEDDLLQQHMEAAALSPNRLLA
jgi:D-arginine dehydrogenase